MTTPSHPEFAKTHIARIQALPLKDQAPHFEALRAQIQAHFDGLAAGNTPMSASDYLNLLSELDVSSASARHDFFSTTCASEVDPVPIGSHAGYDYYLLPNDESVPQSRNPGATPLDAMLPVAPFVDAYRRIQMQGHPPGGPDLKFGMGLGTICYAQTGAFPSGATVDPGLLEEVGFFAVLNVVDKSIWATVNWYPTWRNEAPYTDGDTFWGTLPGDDSYQIGTTKISRPGWKVASRLGDSITGGDPWSVGAPMGCRLERVDAKVRDLAAMMARKT